MKIIKNNFKTVPSQKVRCKHCKSKFRVTYDDLKMNYRAAEASYYFECSCCEGELELSLKKGQKLKKAR